eukprot:s2280_g2.t1
MCPSHVILVICQDQITSNQRHFTQHKQHTLPADRTYGPRSQRASWGAVPVRAVPGVPGTRDRQGPAVRTTRSSCCRSMQAGLYLAATQTWIRVCSRSIKDRGTSCSCLPMSGTGIALACTQGIPRASLRMQLYRHTKSPLLHLKYCRTVTSISLLWMRRFCLKHPLKNENAQLHTEKC